MRLSILFSTRRFQHLRLAAAICVAAWCATAPSALAQTQAPEPDLKAAIISNMLLFVEWPANGTAPSDQIVICYQDVASPVAMALARLDGKSIKGKTLKVAPLGTEGAGKCHALYVSPGNVGGLGKLTASLGALPVFVAGDSPDYAQHGVMLNLDIAAGRVVFDIDLKAAQKAGLQISSKALRLARQVFE